MNEPGFIYILINPSMAGLVKIGKTTRDPEARAKELSQATGVPTPFYVAYYGHGDEIEDKEEAVRLLDKARALNFPAAYTSLAEHYIKMAEGCFIADNPDEAQANYKKAFTILKEGAERGHGRCYVKMADMFLYGYGNPDLKPDLKNAIKCWRKYFRSQTFARDDDCKWTQGVSFLDDYRDSGASRLSYATNYFRSIIFPFDPQILEILLPLRDEILALSRAYVEDIKNEDLDPDIRAQRLADATALLRTLEVWCSRKTGQRSMVLPENWIGD
jgi:hypothetical protein